MKANELMLGYLVLYEYNGEKIRARVVEVYRSSVLVESVSKEYEPIEIEEDKLFPVLLTPEILEKNGFRKLVTYGTEKWLRDNVRLNFYDSGETWRFCADTNRNENSVIYIRFVHELQHALRICGIEKEIEL